MKFEERLMKRMVVARLLVASSCHRSTTTNSEMGATDAALPVATALATPPSRSDRATAGMDAAIDATAQCHFPIASACDGECRTYEQLLADVRAEPMKVNCPTSDFQVHIGSSHGRRVIAMFTGFVGVVDYFDEHGALVGEHRSSDAVGECDSETASFGNFPETYYQAEKGERVLCSDRSDSFQHLFFAKWRARTIETK